MSKDNTCPHCGLIDVAQVLTIPVRGCACTCHGSGQQEGVTGTLLEVSGELVSSKEVPVQEDTTGHPTAETPDAQPFDNVSQPAANPELKTSEEWAKELKDVTVLDPDGWDRKNFRYSWHEELITKEEFDNRVMQSTITGPLAKSDPYCKEPGHAKHYAPPKHGSCCTCQECGKHYDDCVCDDICSCLLREPNHLPEALPSHNASESVRVDAPLTDSKPEKPQYWACYDHALSTGEADGRCAGCRAVHVPADYRPDEPEKQNNDPANSNLEAETGIRPDQLNEKYDKMKFDIDASGRLAAGFASDQLREQQVADLVNPFIEKWVPRYYPHLVDSDDNDGEFLRRAIEALISQREQEAVYKFCKDKTIISGFKCSVHGKQIPEPSCPKCIPQEKFEVSNG